MVSIATLLVYTRIIARMSTFVSKSISLCDSKLSRTNICEQINIFMLLKLFWVCHYLTFINSWSHNMKTYNCRKDKKSTGIEKSSSTTQKIPIQVKQHWADLI